jgi:hypothetical protein
MVFQKHVKNGKNIPRNPDNLCSECGEEIKEGETYYSRHFYHGQIRDTERKPKHFCEECYNKKFIVA